MAKSSFTQRPSFSAAKSRTGKRSGSMRGFFALRHSRDEIAARWREESACRQEACCAFLLLPIASRWNVRGSAAVTIAIVICAITWGHGLRAVWMSTVVPRFGVSAACNCPENDLIFQCIRRYIGTGWRIFMLGGLKK